MISESAERFALGARAFDSRFTTDNSRVIIRRDAARCREDNEGKSGNDN